MQWDDDDESNVRLAKVPCARESALRSDFARISLHPPLPRTVVRLHHVIADDHVASSEESHQLKRFRALPRQALDDAMDESARAIALKDRDGGCGCGGGGGGGGGINSSSSSAPPTCGNRTTNSQPNDVLAAYFRRQIELQALESMKKSAGYCV